MGAELQFGEMESSRDGWWRLLHNNVTVQNATELCTGRWSDGAFHVCFTTILNKQEQGPHWPAGPGFRPAEPRPGLLARGVGAEGPRPAEEPVAGFLGAAEVWPLLCWEVQNQRPGCPGWRGVWQEAAPARWPRVPGGWRLLCGPPWGVCVRASVGKAPDQPCAWRWLKLERSAHGGFSLFMIVSFPDVQGSVAV